MLGSLVEGPGEFAVIQLQNKPGVKHLSMIVIFMDILHFLTHCFWGFSLICLGSGTAQGTVKVELRFHLSVSHSVNVGATGPSPWIGTVKLCCFLLCVCVLFGFESCNPACAPSLCFPPPFVSHTEKLLHRGGRECKNFMCSSV